MHSPTEQLLHELGSKVAQMFHAMPHQVARGVVDGAHLAIGEPIKEDASKGALARSIARVAAPKIQKVIEEITSELRDEMVLYFVDLSEHKAKYWTGQQLDALMPEMAPSDKQPSTTKPDRDGESQRAYSGSIRNREVVQFLISNGWKKVKSRGDHDNYEYTNGRKVQLRKKPSSDIQAWSRVLKQIGDIMVGEVLVRGSQLVIEPLEQTNGKPLSA